MGIAHQLKMLAPVQCRCLECRTPYVPFSKDMFRNQYQWVGTEINWLETQEWVADRSFQANMKFCSPNCAVIWHTREAEIEIERRRHKNYGKRK